MRKKLKGNIDRKSFTPRNRRAANKNPQSTTCGDCQPIKKYVIIKLNKLRALEVSVASFRIVSRTGTPFGYSGVKFIWTYVSFVFDSCYCCCSPRWDGRWMCKAIHRHRYIGYHKPTTRKHYLLFKPSTRDERRKKKLHHFISGTFKKRLGVG